MKYLLAFLMMATAAHGQSLTGSVSGSTVTATMNAGCTLASYNPTGDKVTFDWQCIEKSARGEMGEYNRQMAVILKAARDSGSQPK